MSIALVLSKAMHQSGVTQGELASKIGVTQSYISQICAGKRTPTLGVLVKIVNYLHIPMDSLTLDADGDGEPPSARSMLLSDEEIHVLMCYRAMSSGDQALVSSLASRMAVTTRRKRKDAPAAKAAEGSGI